MSNHKDLLFGKRNSKVSEKEFIVSKASSNNNIISAKGVNNFKKIEINKPSDYSHENSQTKKKKSPQKTNERRKNNVIKNCYYIKRKQISRNNNTNNINFTSGGDELFNKENNRYENTLHYFPYTSITNTSNYSRKKINKFDKDDINSNKEINILDANNILNKYSSKIVSLNSQKIPKKYKNVRYGKKLFNNNKKDIGLNINKNSKTNNPLPDKNMFYNELCSLIEKNQKNFFAELSFLLRKGLEKIDDLIEIEIAASIVNEENHTKLIAKIDNLMEKLNKIYN